MADSNQTSSPISHLDQDRPHDAGYTQIVCDLAAISVSDHYHCDLCDRVGPEGRRIEFDFLLGSNRTSKKGIPRVTKYGAKGCCNHKDTLEFFPTDGRYDFARPQSRQPIATSGNKPVGDMMINLTEYLPFLSRRVTIFVGPKRHPVILPSIFLTKFSSLFRTALEPSGDKAFAEALSQTVSLPEENVMDFVVLVRYLIEKPRHLDSIVDAHWPIDCPDKDGYCCLNPADMWTSQRSHRPPFILRFCAMLERLGFELPEDEKNAVVSGKMEGYVVGWHNEIDVEILKWVVHNTLPSGLVREFAAIQIAERVADGRDEYGTYEPFLMEHHDLAVLVARALAGRMEKDRQEALERQRNAEEAWLYTDV